jgi:hypothetical protein
MDPHSDPTTQSAIEKAKSHLMQVLKETVGAYAEPVADELELVLLDWLRQRLESGVPMFRLVDGALVKGEAAIIAATNSALTKLGAATGVVNADALAQIAAILKSGQPIPVPAPAAAPAPAPAPAPSSSAAPDAPKS